MIFPKNSPKLPKFVILGSLGKSFQGYGTGLIKNLSMLKGHKGKQQTDWKKIKKLATRLLSPSLFPVDAVQW